MTDLARAAVALSLVSVGLVSAQGSQTAQPVALPVLSSAAPASEIARHLLDDADAAIARQTLLQIASLPDRADIAGPRPDQVAPRWNFEIPFATPLGTAIVQFDISRDAAGHDVEAAKRVWRARFSLDVEPTGPVHAVVSLTGDIVIHEGAPPQPQPAPAGHFLDRAL